jgi:Mitochondrial K+-H+ exchange-related
VFLVPVGAGRFELYSEAPDEGLADGEPLPTDGFWRRTIHNAQVRWREAVRAARGGETSAGWFARIRDKAVCRASETVAEQRTLWSLRQVTAATLVHPSDLTAEAAAATRDRLLVHARKHHGKWLVLDAALFVVSGVFMLVPGPNVLAYYFAFRAVGHYLSWRGAQQALERITWDLRAEPALAELGRLAALPRDARASRVEAIAHGMNLPRLAAFFDRTAVGVR